MNCDCPECTRARRLWAWLDGSPGLLLTIFTWALCFGMVLWYAWRAMPAGF